MGVQQSKPKKHAPLQRRNATSNLQELIENPIKTRRARFTWPGLLNPEKNTQPPPTRQDTSKKYQPNETFQPQHDMLSTTETEEETESTGIPRPK